jgi:DNA-binding MarR family transcriptional regulator
MAKALDPARVNGHVMPMTRKASSKKFKDLHELHGLLLDLAGAMNSPQSIAALLREAGVTLDRALFPLLARIDRHGAVGIMELGEMVGRDHTTVSRQVAQLEQIGLVSRRLAATDKRVRHAVIAPDGRELIAAIDAARERMFGEYIARYDVLIEQTP